MTDETPDAGSGGAMPFTAYEEIEAVNWSKLKRMLRSPLHYKHALDAEREPDSPAICVGRATHTAIFEPHRLESEYGIWKGARRAGKVWEDFKSDNAGRTLLTEEEYRRVLRMRDSVRLHPLVAPLLEHGQAEQVLEWTDPATQLRLKCRIDWHGTDLIVDLKTSRNAIDPHKFASDAYALGYFHQLAFYQRGVQANFGTHPQALIVAVENAAPFDVAVYRLASHALYAVHEEIDGLLTLLKQCMASQQWPGRFDTERELSIPAWATSIDDVDVDDPDWMKEAR